MVYTSPASINGLGMLSSMSCSKDYNNMYEPICYPDLPQQCEPQLSAFNARVRRLLVAWPPLDMWTSARLLQETLATSLGDLQYVNDLALAMHLEHC